MSRWRTGSTGTRGKFEAAERIAAWAGMTYPETLALFRAKAGPLPHPGFSLALDERYLYVGGYNDGDYPALMKVDPETMALIDHQHATAGAAIGPLLAVGDHLFGLCNGRMFQWTKDLVYVSQTGIGATVGPTTDGQVVIYGQDDLGKLTLVRRNVDGSFTNYDVVSGSSIDWKGLASDGKYLQALGLVDGSYRLYQVDFFSGAGSTVRTTNLSFTSTPGGVHCDGSFLYIPFGTNQYRRLNVTDHAGSVDVTVTGATLNYLNMACPVGFDGQHLYFAGTNGRVYRWNPVTSSLRTWTGSSVAANAIRAVLHDGQCVYVAGDQLNAWRKRLRELDETD